MMNSHSLAGASDLADQEHATTDLTNLNDLNNPSDASIEQTFDEVVETKNVRETSNTQAEKFEEKFSTN